MAWTVRSLADISVRVRGAFREYLPGTDSALATNFVTVTGKVLAALSHEFELRMAYLARQIFLSTADSQFLVRHAADVGIFRKPAAAASGSIGGTGEANVIYPAGIRFVSGEVTYLSASPASASPSGAITFAVVSEVVGAHSNRDGGGSLALADPILWPALSSEWIISDDGLGGGADIETDEALRARALVRKRNPPGAGTLSDYEQIALAVPGVAKAWAYRDPAGPGFVAVLFLFNGRPNLIPTDSDVEVVQAAIDAKRLIRVDDSVAAAPVAKSVDLTISGLVTDTTAVREAISSAVATVLLEKGKPGVTGDVFMFSRSWIDEAISAVIDEDRHLLVEPAGDVMLTGGEYAVLGEITYVS
ncbi:baseplate J/gp47 family protein [Sinorhizobium sp. BG8]|uniref:baseplate J/gp47 family protein n=1 Tax=Sinorhizobium sp. BG8 TaxID=2613773 RepID=UPI00193EA1F7|nr:baseplate J/gp47 family protein [Sinorhizobium sp. BG8]QRM55155.1 baseplate J/gp47 family protein [Sinorhizobium sp. BG8]